jgi:hypothetical protein
MAVEADDPAGSDDQAMAQDGQGAFSGSEPGPREGILRRSKAAARARSSVFVVVQPFLQPCGEVVVGTTPLPVLELLAE